jgi:hypothetical protein
MFQLALVRGIVIGILGFIFCLTIFFGVKFGIEEAQSRTVIMTALELEKSIDYFFQDNNRYPSNLEFAAQNGLGSYIIPFPPKQFATGSCAESYAYTNAQKNSYELRFCLPRSIKGLPEGWQRFSP